MFKGQILVYRYNGLHNAREGVDRNLYTLRDVSVKTSPEFKHAVEDALDEVPPGHGYVMIRYEGKTYICERDINHPKKGYIRHEILYHPLLDKFTC